MNIRASSSWLFLVAGIYALACIPAIFLAERFSWPEWPFHTTQLLAVVLCFLTSVVFLWSTRGSQFGAQRWLATIASVLCGLWLAFVVYVFLTFNLSGIG
jgi:hypothetical protein